MEERQDDEDVAGRNRPEETGTKEKTEETRAETKDNKGKGKRKGGRELCGTRSVQSSGLLMRSASSQVTNTHIDAQSHITQS